MARITLQTRRYVKFLYGKKPLYLMFLIYIFFFVGVIFSQLVELNEKILVVFLGAMLLGFTVLGSRWFRGKIDEESERLVLIIAMYFFVAYMLKYIYVLYFLTDLWFYGRYIDDVSIIQGLSVGFNIYAVGYVSIIIGMLLTGRALGVVSRTHDSVRMTSTGMNLLATLLTVLIPFKYVMHTYFQVGVPGIEGVYLGIPNLNGLVAFVIGPSLFFAVNIFVYFAFVCRDRNYRGIALLLVFCIVGMDLVSGIKHSLVYEVFILLWYFIDLKQILTPRQKKTLVFSFLITAMFLAIGYKYINFYRFALLSGHDIVSAIDVVVSSSAAKEKSTTVEIYNRINGIDNLLVGVQTLDGISFSIAAVFDQQIVEAFKYVVFLGVDANTAFGLTQLATFYLVGGWFGVVFGMFLLGVIFMCGHWLLMNNLLKKYFGVQKAVAPLIALFFVKVLFAAGGLLLWSKEAFVVVLTIIFVSKLLVARIDAEKRIQVYPVR